MYISIQVGILTSSKFTSFITICTNAIHKDNNDYPIVKVNCDIKWQSTDFFTKGLMTEFLRHRNMEIAYPPT